MRISLGGSTEIGDIRAMTRSSPDPRARHSREFPDLPGAGWSRLLWGIAIGLVVGFVSAILRWNTRSWSDVGLRMGACALVFGVLSWRQGDRFWGNPFRWAMAMFLAGVLLSFL